MILVNSKLTGERRLLPSIKKQKKDSKLKDLPSRRKKIFSRLSGLDS